MGKKKNKSKKKSKARNNNIPNSTKNTESKKERRRRNRQNLKKVASQNFSKFCEQVDKLGLRIKEIRGDGNCMFRAVSDQIEGNENNHEFYRTTAIDYMLANEDHFKFFIEDDQTFEDYIAHMVKDGTWGGNLEIYAISMKFNVNFYIHIYNHPMYIVKNWESPFRNVHLSYHSGSHYNSVRLKEDMEEDIPKEIPLEMINCCEQTNDVNTLAVLEEEECTENTTEKNEEDDTCNIISEKNNDNENEKEIENDNEKESSSKNNKEKSSSSENDNVIITSSNNYEPKENKQYDEANGEISYRGITIKDIIDKPRKFSKSLLTEEGTVVDEIGENKKCHCGSTKKYKNCCIITDIKGEYDKHQVIFYCELESFKNKYQIVTTFMQTNNTNGTFSNENENEGSSEVSTAASNDVASVAKRFEKIFI